MWMFQKGLGYAPENETPASYGLRGTKKPQDMCLDARYPEGKLRRLAIHTCTRRAGALGPRASDGLSTVMAFKEVFPEVFEAAGEGFFAVLLNSNHRIMGIHKVASGGLAAVVVLPREAFEAALVIHAVAVIFIHNHPSGDVKPSQDDLALTVRLKQAGSVLGVKVLDHIIVGSEPTTRDPVFYSMVNEGTFGSL